MTQSLRSINATLHNTNKALSKSNKDKDAQIKKLTEALEGVSKWFSTRNSDVTTEFDTAKLDGLLAEIKG